MNRLSRKFTVLERVLLLVLCLILMGAAYYYYVYTPLSAELSSVRSERDLLDAELLGIQTRVAELTRMQNEINMLNEESSPFRMESYNNETGVLMLLDGALKPVDTYQLGAQRLTRDGDLVRRSFSLQFTVPDLRQAESILDKISHSGRRCLLGDLSCSISEDDGKTQVNVSTIVTFYETMVGAVPDAGLPEESGGTS